MRVKKVKVKKPKKEKKIQLPVKFDRTLPSGKKVSVTIEQGKQVIQRKVYVRNPNGPGFISVKVEKKHMRVPVKVQGIKIIVKHHFDGTTVDAVSCCKWPDVYRGKVGKRRAMKHLFRQSPLKGDDREALFRAIMRNGKIRKPKKPKEGTELVVAEQAQAAK